MGIVTLQLEPNATHLPHWHKGYELLFVINVSATRPNTCAFPPRQSCKYVSFADLSSFYCRET